MKALCFGEIVWDVYPDKSCLGGAPLNFAAHLVLHGDSAYMLSALGKDELGERAVMQMQKWGVSAEYITVLNDKKTGRCIVELDENSVPTYKLLNDTAYDYISCKNPTDDFDVFYFGTLALRSSHNFDALRKLLSSMHFKEVFADVNLREPFYSADTVRFALQNATIAKISLEELPTVLKLLDFGNTETHEKAAEILADKFKNLSRIVITLGGDGAYALDCTSGAEYYCKSENVKVASTVGAGDSFSAAFMHKLMSENDALSCLEYASRVAGFVVSRFDAVPDYSAEDFE